MKKIKLHGTISNGARAGAIEENKVYFVNHSNTIRKGFVMLSKRRATPIIIFLSLVFLLSLGLFSGVSQAQEQVSAENTPVLFQAIDIGNENHTMYIGLYLIECYSFEYKSGSYTFDFYVRFLWTDPNIKTADWYLMNGYPTYPGAKILVDENKTGNVKWELYRMRANLNVPIEPVDYPFDRIELPISIELLTHNYDISFVWLKEATGIGPGFTNVGWSRPVYELNTSFSNYPFERVEPRADMVILQDRNVYGAFMKTIFPLLIFCFVSGVCFLFKMNEDSAFGLRVGIGTSMLISAVLFNIAEQNDIPPVTRITLYNLLIAAVVSFLALFLIVTILGYVEWKRSQDEKKVERVNRIGFVVSLAVPVLVLTLFLVK
jgi:hypothetical protein